MSTAYKPKQTPQQLIDKMRDEKGIRFCIMDEASAIQHLANRNNYLRTASYRKNYEKHILGSMKGKYIDLDFAYLVELSTIDMYLRPLLLRMCIDIEHDLKIELLRLVENNPSEDGYSIVKDFLANNSYIIDDIERKADTIFNGDLINSYFSLCYVFDANNQSHAVQTKVYSHRCPIWVLVELLSFGDLLKLCEFYNKRNSSSSLVIDRKVLNPIKSLRNACAHNNCLLYSLNRSAGTTPPPVISSFIKGIRLIQNQERNNKLKCRPLLEISCLLYYYQEHVSPDVRRHNLKELQFFTSTRMVKHIDYFRTNPKVLTSLLFLQKIIDNLA